ncbi:hypothetical protein BG006_003652, partial [Podila minutissima]
MGPEPDTTPQSLPSFAPQSWPLPAPQSLPSSASQSSPSSIPSATSVISLTSLKHKETSTSSLDPLPAKAAKCNNTGKSKAINSKTNALKPSDSKTSSDLKQVFSEVEVLWLAHQLADPEVYMLLQTDRESTVWDTPKEHMYKWLAKDVCEEFPEFKFNKKQIKNKIARMKPMFISMLKHKKGSGF